MQFFANNHLAKPVDQPPSWHRHKIHLSSWLLLLLHSVPLGVALAASVVLLPTTASYSCRLHVNIPCWCVMVRLSWFHNIVHIALTVFTTLCSCAIIGFWSRRHLAFITPKALSIFLLALERLIVKDSFVMIYLSARIRAHDVHFKWKSFICNEAVW